MFIIAYFRVGLVEKFVQIYKYTRCSNIFVENLLTYASVCGIILIVDEM